MTHLVGFLLFVASLVGHEAGHAIAMYRRGIEIEEMGIGLPIGKFKLTWRPRFLSFPIIFSPLLVAAYVKPTDKGAEQMEALSYKDKTSYMMAGVIMNFLFAGAILSVYLTSALLTPGYAHRHTAAVVLVVTLIVTPLLFVLRRPFSWAAPVLGIVALAFTIYLVALSPGDAAGPIATLELAFGATTWRETLLISAALSLSLGMFNILPLVPLDGGHVMEATLEALHLDKARKVFAGVSMTILLACVVVLIAKDVLNLF